MTEAKVERRHLVAAHELILVLCQNPSTTLRQVDGKDASAQALAAAEAAGRQGAECPWSSLARWCSVHAKDRRIGCNDEAPVWRVWAEWNDCTIEVGRGDTADSAAADLCDRLATRHPSSALPPSKPGGPT